jgi:outer membrane lipoprotein-sorting protein
MIDNYRVTQLVMIIFKKIFFLFLISLTFFNVAHAEYNELLLKNYLKSLKSVAIEFEQTLDNKTDKGILLIQKPYNFRCNYFENFPLLITGNSKFISVYDYDLDELSNISKDDNMLRFIILKDKDIDKLNISEIIDHSDSVEFISKEEDNSQSSIILSKSPLKLKRISLYNFNNNEELIIDFKEINQVKNFDPSLFSIKNPKIFGIPNKLSSKELKQFLHL